MFGRIPPLGRKIDAANKRQRIIDHHHFLMMRPSNGMPRIKPQVDPRMRIQLGFPKHAQGFSRIDRTHRPDKNVNRETAIVFDKRDKELT